MATSNRDRVGKALDLLQNGLKPFVEREMQAEYGNQWLTQASYSLRNLDEKDPHFDVQALLLVMWDQWNSVFNKTLGHAERSLVSELRNWRNKWAHQEPFTTDDAYRALDSAARLLTAISAPEAREVERQKQELLRVRFEEQARRQQRKAAVLPTAGSPVVGLKPWREIATPHPDVASGRYQQAEFAADLAAVHQGDVTAGSEYRDPEEFYRRTFITDGLRRLIETALGRISNQGGDPVVELKTNFGGGKTHSMLALYHLFSGAPASSLPGIEPILDSQGLKSIPEARRVVIVGTALSPGQPHQKPDGIWVHTLWGELAWQLGGAEGYSLVAEADQQGVSPGSTVLRQLFNRYSPALILIDEWVAYIRQLYRKHDLSGGSFDANLTFAQALTEAAKQSPGVLVVASLPASDIEIGGEGGKEALERLQNTFGRVETTWRPASAEESFEIVRRRLFQPITEPELFTQRDAVIRAFSQYYQKQPQEFPVSAKEGDYERRMQAAYPIHPELFDRLYTDWSTLERFQRTRGVLRLMAAVIHALWERNDSNLLILPGAVPIDDPAVQHELTRYLEDNWVPVIERDVDGPQSLPLALDRENPNLGRYSACRRVARTIYLGSAPTSRGRNPGIDERNIKLGCAQPGESVATFGDALRRLSDNATFLYVDRSRYWFSTQPSVTRVAQDRAAQLETDIVWEELRRRLRAERRRGELSAVHAAPMSGADVPDQPAVRLVILGPEHPHVRRGEVSPAAQQARLVLESRGAAPRQYQNMLVFLAPDANRLSELEEALRQHLAWKSIDEEQEQLNLDAFQRNQARTRRDDTDKTVDARILETYIWLLSPAQPDPGDKKSLYLEEARLQGQDSLAVRASRKLINEEWLITNFGGLRLRMAMDSFNLWRDQDHVQVKQVWEDIARYPYLPRLRDEQVLLGAVQDGIAQTTWQENFAYAAGYDEVRGRYLGLVAGQVGSVHMDGESLLVKPEAALRQMEREAPAPTSTDGAPSPMPVAPDSTSGVTGDAPTTSEAPEKKLQRFYGSVQMDPMRMTRDAGTIAEAIIQHLLAHPGADVTVTLEIQARLPDGASEQTVRTVTENARTLGFDALGFEET